MPTFEYEAMNAKGEAVVDRIEARNNDEAIQKLRAMDLIPTRVRELKATDEGPAAAAEGGCALAIAAVVLPALGAGVWALLA